jgi:hypothetical protein
MAYADGPTDKQLRHLPGLAIVEMHGEYFKLYKVDREQRAK